MHSWMQCNCQKRPALYQRLAVSSPVGEPGMVAGRRLELYPRMGCGYCGRRGHENSSKTKATASRSLLARASRIP